MTQTAIVKRVLEGGKAEVEVRRVSACGHSCEECGGGCSELTRSEPVRVVAENRAGARAGDRVEVSSSTNSVLGAAALVYLVPFALFFLGYLISGLFGLSEGISIAVGGVCFVLCMAAIIRFDRKLKGRVTFTILGPARD